MPDLTRCFVALPIPDAGIAALVALQRALAAELPGVRWVGAPQLHLTLAFLGEVPGADLPALGAAIATAVAGLPAFELSLRGLGVFPDARRPRVLWAGLVGPGLPALTDLQRALVAAVTAAGHPPADDRFHPHVTLGRLDGPRGRGPRRAGPGPEPLAASLGRHAAWDGGPCPVAGAILYASRLGPGGPAYTPLARAPLAAAAGSRPTGPGAPGATSPTDPTAG